MPNSSQDSSGKTSPILVLARVVLGLRRQAIKLFATRGLTEAPFLLGLSIIIGLGGGFGAFCFRWLIAQFNHLFLIEGAGFLGNEFLLPLIPAMGGLIVGFIVIKLAPEARGSGIPEVMASVAAENGRIRTRVMPLKALASAICIGSGGSVGREGPIVHIVSSFGSSVGQLFRFSGERLKVLVGCGAAAGISATFNAPIAGGLFSLEVILGDFSVRTFSPILLSSVVANAVSRHTIGHGAAFDIPKYQLTSPFELFSYAGLAILAGVVAVLLIRLLYLFEDAFDKLPISRYMKPALGGAFIGCIGMFLPQIFGVGYEAITDTLLGRTEVSLILILLVAKILATSLTIGSGGSGGVFAPSLFIGAMLGGSYGHLAAYLLPGATSEVGAYALVGMGAVVAGTTHAPLTAMLILLELTDDYLIILPLILATVISTLVARHLEKESIYTLKLSRRGLRVAQGVDMSVLDSIQVQQAMSTSFDFVEKHTPLGQVATLLQHGESVDFPVVDKVGSLQGVISFQDIRSVMMDTDLYSLLIAADAMNSDSECVEADAPLSRALSVFATGDISSLPVVDDSESRTLVGVITRSNMMSYYHQEIQRRTRA